MWNHFQKLQLYLHCAYPISPVSIKCEMQIGSVCAFSTTPMQYISLYSLLLFFSRLTKYLHTVQKTIFIHTIFSSFSDGFVLMWKKGKNLMALGSSLMKTNDNRIRVILDVTWVRWFGCFGWSRWLGRVWSIVGSGWVRWLTAVSYSNFWNLYFNQATGTAMHIPRRLTEGPS